MIEAEKNMQGNPMRISEGGIDCCLLVEPPALVLVFIYEARLNAIYTAKLS